MRRKQLIRYPDLTQRDKIDNTFWCGQFVYNEMLKIRQENKINLKQSLSILNDLKRDNARLREVDAIALQQAVKQLDYEYQKFFAKCGSYPLMKKVLHSYVTYNNNNSIRMADGKIRIPKLGFVKTEPDKIIENISSVLLVKKNAKDYYIYIKQRNN